VRQENDSYAEEVAFNLSDGVIHTSSLNLILSCIYYQKADTLKYLVERFGVEQSYQYNLVGANDLGYSNLLLPLNLKNKNSEIFAYLLK